MPQIHSPVWGQCRAVPTITKGDGAPWTSETELGNLFKGYSTLYLFPAASHIWWLLCSGVDGRTIFPTCLLSGSFKQAARRETPLLTSLATARSLRLQWGPYKMCWGREQYSFLLSCPTALGAGHDFVLNIYKPKWKVLFPLPENMKYPNKMLCVPAFAVRFFLLIDLAFSLSALALALWGLFVCLVFLAFSRNSWGLIFLTPKEVNTDIGLLVDPACICILRTLG